MKDYNARILNAFATEKSSGNPSAYCLLENMLDLTSSEMLQIAKKYGSLANAFGFVVKKGVNEIDICYYSPEREIDFCGSVTIAAMYDIIKNDDTLRGIDVFNLNTKQDKLLVFNKINSDDSVFVLSPSPKNISVVPRPVDIEKSLNLKENQINNDLPISIINAGLTTLLVPINNLEAILEISPDYATLKQFCVTNNINIVEVFTSETESSSNNYRARVFTPIYGPLEDPATGSGNSALGNYLLENNLWEDNIVRIEQNGSKKNYNIVKLQKTLRDNKTVGVCFGGSAVLSKAMLESF